jgi:orotate phosphoribosyltransferase
MNTINLCKYLKATSCPHEYPLFDRKQALMNIVRKKGIVVPGHKVTLSSGEKSDYYYDLKKISLDPKAIDLIGDLLLEEIVLRYGRVKSVGGMASGAVPLVTAVVMKSSDNGGGITGFFVRKERKTYGLQKVIEGKIIAPVVIVDDVITTGGSIREAIDAVRDEGFNVRGVLTLLDREENNGLKSKIKYFSVLKHSDFARFIEKQLKRKKKTKIEN